MSESFRRFCVAIVATFSLLCMAVIDAKTAASATTTSKMKTQYSNIQGNNSNSNKNNDHEISSYNVRAETTAPKRYLANTINVLGGPEPNGWINSTIVDNEANLAYDLGALYEQEANQDKMHVYKNGVLPAQAITLESLGKYASGISSQDPMFTYYTYALNQIGRLEGAPIDGNFDGQPVEEYADTIVKDLFDAEALKPPGLGIEKEATIILGLWMRFHHHIYEVMRICRDDGSNQAQMIENLDKAVAFWIGRMQIHGDNARGTMLYNLAERSGVHFSQDQGEVPVNRKMMGAWTFFKTEIESGTCSSEDGYKMLYLEMINVEGMMNVPLVQNFIHHVISGAPLEIIELYAVSLFPQIISCDITFIDYFDDELHKLARKPRNDDNLSKAISLVRKMYGCLGLTCDDVGAHISGSACNDDELNPIRAIVGYTPNTDVRNLLRFDQDINQIQILLQDGNREAAYDVYKFGRNAIFNNELFSLRKMAQHEGLIDSTHSPTRLHQMYETFYTNEGGTNFADTLVTDVFEHSPVFAPYTVPLFAQIIISPLYALRAFFQARDTCEDDRGASEGYWDQGVAALIGSIEGESVPGNPVENGMSWYDIGKEFCSIFKCGDTDTDNPIFNRKMMENVNFGRDLIRQGRCDAVLNKVIAMESLLVTPLLLGTLFHTYERAKSTTPQKKDMEFAYSFVFGKAIVPFLKIASKEDAKIIQEKLFSNNDFNLDDAKVIWTAVLLSLDNVGIDCTHMGDDLLGLLSSSNLSFCNLSQEMTKFPTPAPQPGTAVPTKIPTSFPSPVINLSLNEIHSDFSSFFTDIESATSSAKIALDVRDIARSKSHIATELLEARSIYVGGSTNTPPLITLRKYGMHDLVYNSEDPIYCFYRDAFRGNTLFNGNDGNIPTFNTYADAVVTDAFDTAKDIELASEAIVIMTVYMKIIHSLSSAVSKCRHGNGNEALEDIDIAFATYIGVGQSKGKTDGSMYYAFAQRAAVHYGTMLQDEAVANTEIVKTFIEVKANTEACGSASFQTLRLNVGKIISQMNIPLVQQFLFLLEQTAYVTEETNYLELYALAVLPHIKTCQPGTYTHLNFEIAENGLNLDVAQIGSLVTKFKETYSCFGLTCGEVHGENYAECNSDEERIYAGYRPETDATLSVVMDRDLLKVLSLMREEAPELALEYFNYGHIVTYDQQSSLKQLSLDQSNNESNPNPYISDYEDVITLITNAITGILDFSQMSVSDRVEIVFRSIQTIVFVQAAISALFHAENDCVNGSTKNLDRAAAYLIGSVEGGSFGGDKSNQGVSIYGFAKTLCDIFNVCTESNDADSNKYLIAALSKGKDFLTASQCYEFNDHMEKRTIPLIIVSLIQATIQAVNTNDTTGSYVLGLAIFPFLESVDPQIATTIKEGTRLQGNINVHQTMEAFANVLRKLWVDCTDIGFVDDINKNMCSFNGTKIESSYSFSGGLYVTSTHVEDFANIAKDIEFIQAAMLDGDVAAAKSYYEYGLFSEKYDSSGHRIGKRSVSKFSTEETSKMLAEPVFNLYRFALGDVESFGDNVSEYANSVTMSIFNGNGIFSSSGNSHSGKSLAVESAIALNVWSMIVHTLYETIRHCESDSFSTESEGIHNIDIAVAYWIGSTQTIGDSDKGHLLYRLAEEGADLFNTVSHDNQAKVNRSILRLFKEASMHLSFQGACYNGGNTFVTSQLRYITNKILAQMTVPLIQHLIYNLKRNHRDRVKIYSYAFVPLVASCDRSCFEYLKDKLIVNDYTSDEVFTIILTIHSSLRCLDLKCKDIGHFSGIPKCEDGQKLGTLADYTPITDMQKYMNIDIDIRYIEIMLKMDAIDAAREIYNHGKHVIITAGDKKETLSLRYLATSTKREIVPSFTKFRTYFDTKNYAHDLIESIFAQYGLIEASKDQYVTLIVDALRYQVLYMAAITKAYEAVAGCQSQSQAQAIQARYDWDTAAAFIIGSMQRSSNSISTQNEMDGYLLWNLGLRQCDKFNKCALTNFAVNNEDILNVLYVGSFELSIKSTEPQGSCNDVRNGAAALERFLLVPLIQGTLDAAYLLDDISKTLQDSRVISSSSISQSIYASGYIYSRAILPYIYHEDSNAAQVISRNLNFQFDMNPMMDGFDTVFSQVSSAVEKMGLCNNVGYMVDVKRKVCSGRPTSSATRMSTTSNSWGSIATGVLMLLPTAVLFFLQ